MVYLSNPYYAIGGAEDLVQSLFEGAAREYLSLRDKFRLIEKGDISAAKRTAIGKKYLEHCERSQKPINEPVLLMLAKQNTYYEMSKVIDGLHNETVNKLMTIAGYKDPDYVLEIFIKEITEYDMTYNKYRSLARRQSNAERARKKRELAADKRKKKGCI